MKPYIDSSEVILALPDSGVEGYSKVLVVLKGRPNGDEEIVSLHAIYCPCERCITVREERAKELSAVLGEKK